MNKLGHCVSYNTVEEIETELTFEATKENKMTPNGMEVAPEYGTGLAWDNFDKFVETQGGKDTIHDNVGIAYQLGVQQESAGPSTQSQTLTSRETSLEHVVKDLTTKRKRRRAYEAKGTLVQPYRKKPKC